MARLLTIMGSGETSPTMVKTHRALIDRTGGPAVMLDTPFGFQENAGELAEKAVQYFAESVGADLTVAPLRRPGTDPVGEAKAYELVARAGYVFAGPGSPTYALRQWAGTPLPGLLIEKLREGGGVTFASAAALTLGVVTVPVYEIYKVGAEPAWLPGLDLLGAVGLNAAVIPHYNNAEGGHHDTRFCYLGERRLAQLEEELPGDAFVLGVDEHTGCILDLDAGTATVVGLGVVTVRRAGHSTELPTGTTVTFDELRDPAGATGRSSAPAEPATPTPGAPAGTGSARSPLLEAVAAADHAFTTALAAGDAEGAVRAVLDLDTELLGWAADTLQSDEMDRARATLRSMIVRLGDAATRGLEPRASVVGPYVDLVLAARVRARAEKNWAESDALRDGLVGLGVEVQDTPEGTTWQLPDSDT